VPIQPLWHLSFTGRNRPAHKVLEIADFARADCIFPSEPFDILPLLG
jgi:hypothetical protein